MKVDHGPEFFRQAGHRFPKFRRPAVRRAGQFRHVLQGQHRTAQAEPAEVAEQEKRIDLAARSLGSDLPNPMMYMFFLPITAIPDYAITDVGPVDYCNLTTFDPVLGLREA